MNQEEELLALVISKLNKLLQSGDVTRVQIDAENDMTFDGTHNLDINVTFRPKTDGRS